MSASVAPPSLEGLFIEEDPLAVISSRFNSTMDKFSQKIADAAPKEGAPGGANGTQLHRSRKNETAFSRHCLESRRGDLSRRVEDFVQSFVIQESVCV